MTGVSWRVAVRMQGSLLGHPGLVSRPSPSSTTIAASRDSSNPSKAPPIVSLTSMSDPRSSIDLGIDLGTLLTAFQSHPVLLSMPLVLLTRFMHCLSLLKDDILQHHPNTTPVDRAPPCLSRSIIKFLTASFSLSEPQADLLWAVLKNTIWALPTEDEERIARKDLLQQYGHAVGITPISLYPPAKTCQSPACITKQSTHLICRGDHSLLSSHPMSAFTYKPSHQLSIKSTQLKRNLFVWSLDLGRPGLHGGLELHEYNKVTVASLYRWIELVLTYQAVENRWSGDAVKENSFELYRASVKPDPQNISVYLAEREGDVLSRESNAPLSYGEMGIRLPGASADPTLAIDFPTGNSEFKSVFDREAAMRKDGVEVEYALSDEAFKTSVVERDHGRCLITKTAATAAQPLTVTWIYAPCLGTEAYGISLEDFKEIKDDESEYVGTNNAISLRADAADLSSCSDYGMSLEDFEEIRDDESEYVGMDNAISLRADVADLFKQNQLGIDVDDNYRVVFFGFPDTFEPKPECQIHLDLTTTGDSDTRPSDKFFRRHFRHCLLVNFFGGDIIDDPQSEDLNADDSDSESD